MKWGLQTKDKTFLVRNRFGFGFELTYEFYSSKKNRL